MPARFSPALLFLLAGCAPNVHGGGTCSLGLAATIPYTYRDHRIVLDGAINDTKVALLLDTGAQRSVLTPAFVDRADLREQPKNENFNNIGTGIGGSRTNAIVLADSVALGSLHGTQLYFLESDVMSGFPGIDGLLSTDILSSWDIDFDTAGKTIALYQPMGDCQHPTVRMSGDVTVVPLATRRGNDGYLLLDVTIGGRTVRAMLDSGASTTLFHEAVAKLGVDPATLQAVQGSRLRRIDGIGPGTVAASSRVLLPMHVGDLEIDNLPVAIADGDSPDPDDFDMLLGLDFFRLVHTWASYSSNTLVLQPYHPFEDPPTAPVVAAPAR